MQHYFLFTPSCGEYSLMNTVHAQGNVGAGLIYQFKSTQRTPERPPKTSKTGHFGVLRNISNDTNISAHAGSAPQSCFGSGHVTVLSTPPRKMDYSGVPQHRCSRALDFCSASSEWKE